MKKMYVLIKKPLLKTLKLRHTFKPLSIKALCKSLIAHKKISLPDRGKDKDKIFI